MTYDFDGGQLRVEGPGATESTLEELLSCLNSRLSFFGLVSTQARKMQYVQQWQDVCLPIQ